MSEKPLKYILEGSLLAAGRPLSIDQMLALFLDSEQPGRDEIRVAKPHFAARCKAEEFFRRVFHKIIALNPEFAGEGELALAGFGVFRGQERLALVYTVSVALLASLGLLCLDYIELRYA